MSRRVGRRAVLGLPALGLTTLLGGDVISPLALPSIAGQVQRAQDTAEAIGLRIGVVTGFSSGTITVSISGSPTLVDATYMFGSYFPALGDTVSLVRQGASWVVLGALSNLPFDVGGLNGANAVAGNGSFDGPNFTLGALPSGWQSYNVVGSPDGGTPAVAAMPDGRQLHGANALHVHWTGGGNKENILLSPPIRVQGGQVWGISAWMQGNLALITDVLSGGVGAAWFDSESAAYPGGTVAADTLVSDSAFPSPYNQWQRFASVTNGAVVPAAARYMRVMLQGQVTLTAPYTGEIFWDRVIATRVS